nr:Ku protein [Gemmatimonadota bacterium]NIU76570.1 Ku protein [Gammaproteobacteria bacterium]NIU29563.1 Ku protein [Gemmatimonadota bacterium]NIV59976.1 Ku protein [Gemmatimonadota bacterium]NIV81538.1 Ku protein [Gemmatimonadota bacterium]
GLVSVPCKLYTAADSSSGISFNMIDPETGSRVKYQYVRASDGEKVERSELVKGYEFAKDRYVTFTDEELKAIEAKSDNSIEIEEFVPREQVGREFIDKIYYLGPDKGGDRAYRLLSRAMRETGLSALGRYAARGKQYLVLLTPKDEGVIMEQLRYADEIRPFSEVPIGDAEVKEGELKLAVQLIEQISNEEFEPEKYTDEVRDRVLELIEAKVEGEDITVSAAEEPQAQIIDLMEALKASLDEGGERKPAKRASSGKTGRKKAGGASG